ncbi:MAG: hypothetical protein Q4D38_05590 [Planctomycetia bacterium]|nr:hypothetical protein [Planctomycetia bacterium]
MNEKYLKALGVCWKSLSVALFVVSVYWFTSLTIYLGNVLDFCHITLTQLLVVNFVLSTLGVVFLVGIMLCFGKTHYFRYILLFFLASGFCMWLESYVLLWKSSSFWLASGELVLFAGLFFVVYYFSSFFFQNAPKIAWVLILAQAAVVLPNWLSYDEDIHKQILPYVYLSGEIDQKDYTLSGEKNVIIFVLDSFGRGFYNDIVASSSSDFLNPFKDFTSFSKCMSLYPATQGALPTLLSGARGIDDLNLWDDDKTVYEQSLGGKTLTLPKMLEIFKGSPNILPQHLKEEGFLCFYDTHVNFRICIPVDCGFEYDHELLQRLDKPISSTVLTTGIIPLATARMSPHMYKDRCWSFFTEWIWYAYAIYCGDENSESEERSLTVRMPRAKCTLEEDHFFMQMPSVLPLQDMPIFRVYHLMGPHNDDPSQYVREPYVLKGKMDLEGVAKYLELLKAAGKYDDSYIVIMGDHGNHLEPLLERKNPILLIKRPGDAHEKIVESDEPVFIRDIAPTILSDLGIVTKEPYSVWNLSEAQKEERRKKWDEIKAADARYR